MLGGKIGPNTYKADYTRRPARKGLSSTRVEGVDSCRAACSKQDKIKAEGRLSTLVEE